MLIDRYGCIWTRSCRKQAEQRESGYADPSTPTPPSTPAVLLARRPYDSPLADATAAQAYAPLLPSQLVRVQLENFKSILACCGYRSIGPRMAPLFLHYTTTTAAAAAVAAALTLRWLSISQQSRGKKRGTQVGWDEHTIRVKLSLIPRLF